MTNNFIDLADAGEDNDSNLGVAKDGELLSLYRRFEGLREIEGERKYVIL